MERPESIKLAEKLGLEFKKNISTKKLLEMIAEAMSKSIVAPKEKVYCGKHPSTGKEVWK